MTVQKKRLIQPMLFSSLLTKEGQGDDFKRLMGLPSVSPSHCVVLQAFYYPDLN